MIKTPVAKLVRSQQSLRGLFFVKRYEVDYKLFTYPVFYRVLDILRF